VRRMASAAERLRGAVRIERHRYGPRLFVLGHRVHECAVGLALLAAALAATLAGLASHAHGAEAAAVAAWLVIKDWRDLFPSKRNTGRWSLLPHRVPRD
jgi:hypothetical protein